MAGATGLTPLRSADGSVIKPQGWLLQRPGQRGVVKRCDRAFHFPCQTGHVQHVSQV